MMIRLTPISKQSRSSAASDVYKRQILILEVGYFVLKPKTEMTEEEMTGPDPDKVEKKKEDGEEDADDDDDDGEPKQGCCSRCITCLLYTSPSPRDRTRSRMPSSA
eukprot:TRINITY_DN17302_c0_g1_i1.p2 TRINITY_DN17302_c0_g1~~TRINITY_DN17302_c0_g1_i1.p2  ORF type:complete len:106 (-),score=50.97 TRINITY_DN17302_c0_g1_i1:6-323(-)